VQAPAAPDIAIVFGPVSAGGEPPVELGDAVANPQPGMVAAGDKAPSDPPLGAPDPSGQPTPSVVIAEQPPDVTAAKAARAGEAETVQAPAAPDIAIVFGPVSAGGEPPVELGDAAASPQPSAQASIAADRGANAMITPAQATPPQQLARSTRRAAPLPDARDLIEALLRRGDEFLKTGDIAAARLFYERAAKAGSARAAMLAGKTYDPLYFAEIGARGIVADRTKAVDWYGKAAGLGDREAKARLEKLRTEAQQ
jgi:TPR repeat protein